MTNARDRVTGTVLVLLQFLLLGALALGAALVAGPSGAPAIAWLLGIAGLALGAWAVTCNRPGNFNIRPEPRAGGHLVVAGPYRWIRHPMYTAVLAVAAACALAIGSVWGWAGVLALAGVLVAKANVEARAMLAAHAGYGAYRARTKRFVPWLV